MKYDARAYLMFIHEIRNHNIISYVLLVNLIINIISQNVTKLLYKKVPT